MCKIGHHARMSESPISRLTDKEKEALRRVADNRQSKQIAIELGITHHAVKGRIKSAMSKLDVHSRQDAARILLMDEKPEQFRDPLPLEKRIYPTGDIEVLPPEPDDRNVIDQKGQLVTEGRKRTDAPVEYWIMALFKFSGENNLSVTSSIVIMILVAFGGMFIVGLIMFIAEGLSRFFAV
jgi:DNA-binding CsgD family transcriptional regulator